MNIKSALNLLIRSLLNFILFLIPVIFFQPFNDPFGPAQLAMIRVFIPALIVLYMLKIKLEGIGSIRKSPFMIPLKAYMLVLFVSIFFSINKEISAKYLIEMALYISGAYFIYAMSERKDISRMIFIILLSHTLISFYGILQHFEIDVFRWNTNFSGRPMGTIGNPDFFAGELLISVFLLFAYAVYSQKYRFFTWGALFLNVLCLLYTKVAGVYIGFAAGLFYFAMLFLILKRERISQIIKQRKKQAIIVFAAAIILLVAASPVLVSKSISLFKDKQRSLTHRMLMWEASILMAKDSPVAGKGFGSYRMNYPYYQGILLNDTKNSEYDYVVTWMPHQQYLHILAESGILGLGAFLAVIFIFYRICWDVFIRKKRANIILIGLSSVITALLVSSFFNTFYNIASTTLFFFLFIMLSAHISGYEKREQLKPVTVNIILAAFVFVMIMNIAADGKTLASNAYLKKANKLTKDKFLKQAIEYHERILELAPVELVPQADVGQFYYAAEAYREAGMINKAYENYKADLKINPYCPEVNNMFGAISGQTGHIEDALKHLKLAVFVAPHYDAATTNLATAYMAAKDTANARKALEDFIRVNGPDEKMQGLLQAIDRIEGK